MQDWLCCLEAATTKRGAKHLNSSSKDGGASDPFFEHNVQWVLNQHTFDTRCLMRGDDEICLLPTMEVRTNERTPIDSLGSILPMQQLMSTLTLCVRHLSLDAPSRMDHRASAVEAVWRSSRETEVLLNVEEEAPPLLKKKHLDG